MKEYNFDNELKKQVDFFDSDHKANFNKSEIWKQIHHRLHPHPKIRLIHLVSVAAMLLLILNIGQFVSNQQFKSKLRQINTAYAHLEKESINTKFHLDSMITDNRKQGSKIALLQNEIKRDKSQPLVREKTIVVTDTVMVTKYVAIQKKETKQLKIDEQIAQISSPAIIQHAHYTQISNNSKVYAPQNQERIQKSSINKTEPKENSKPHFKIRLGNNYRRSNTNNNNLSQTEKKLVIRTYL